MRHLLLGSMLGLSLTADLAAQATLQFSARAELTYFRPDTAPAWLIRETHGFLAPRASVYGELFVGRPLYLLAEVRADRGEAPADRRMQVRIEQLLVRYAPFADVDFNLQAGKFISPFGNYPLRSHTRADPFIRPPLNYDYRTTIVPAVAPRTARGFIDWKDNDSFFRPQGSPIVWAVPYQIGVMAFGSRGPAAFRLALMNSAPSSEPADWDKWFGDVPGPSVVAHVGYQLWPELRLGASFNHGAYRDSTITSDVDRDYNQQILGLELTATRGLFEARAEVLFDRWEVPNVAEDPREFSYFGEVKWKLLPGLAGAVRYGRIDFNVISDEFNRREEWDYDISRWQIGALYSLTEKIELRAEYMVNRGGTRDPRDNLLSVQAAWVTRR